MSQRLLDPPLRFALLCSSLTSSCDPPHSLYRGALPKPRSFPFLSTLHLHTIISLTPESLDHYSDQGLLPARRAREGVQAEESWEAWRDREGVNVVHIKIKAGKAKDGVVPFTPETVKQVLEILIAKDNYPVYIHDLDGSDALSIMGAALRKLQGWSEKAWLEEMSRFLRQPPPEPEHLTFLRRLFSPSLPSLPSPSPSPPLAIHIPPSSKRVEWLWKRGMPVLASGKKSGRAASSGLHASMRCCFEEEETEGTSKAAV